MQIVINIMDHVGIMHTLTKSCMHPVALCPLSPHIYSQSTPTHVAAGHHQSMAPHWHAKGNCLPLLMTYYNVRI